MSYKCHDDKDKPKFAVGEVLKNYEISEEIGHGAFLVVYKAKEIGLGGNVIALKCYSLRSKFKACAETELANFGLIGKHKNIANDFIEQIAYRYEDVDRTALILPLAVGDLFYIMKSRGQLPLGLAYDGLIQVTAGLGHLHSRNFAHGDIKPENVLVYLSKTEWCLKLTDFEGLLHYDKSGVTMNDVRITSEYAPPEYILQDEFKKSSDIWSLGCLFYEMCTQSSMFSLHGDSYGSESADSDVSRNESERKSEMHDEKENDDDTDYEETLSANDIMHLTMIVNHIGPFPKRVASDNSDVFTRNGHVRNIKHSVSSIEELLMDNGVGKTGADIVGGIIRPMMSYFSGKRPSCSAILKGEKPVFLPYFEEDSVTRVSAKD